MACCYEQNGQPVQRSVLAENNQLQVAVSAYLGTR